MSAGYSPSNCSNVRSLLRLMTADEGQIKDFSSCFIISTRRSSTPFDRFIHHVSLPQLDKQKCSALQPLKGQLLQ